MTRLPAAMAAGVEVTFSHKGVMGPWYGVCCDYMLEVAHMGLHVAQMTSLKGIRACFDAVTVNAAKVMHLDNYGIAPGCDASFVLLQARDAVEAIRLRANRLKAWKKGTLLGGGGEGGDEVKVRETTEGNGFLTFVDDAAVGGSNGLPGCTPRRPLPGKGYDEALPNV